MKEDSKKYQIIAENPDPWAKSRDLRPVPKSLTPKECAKSVLKKLAIIIGMGVIVWMAFTLPSPWDGLIGVITLAAFGLPAAMLAVSCLMDYNNVMPEIPEPKPAQVPPKHHPSTTQAAAWRIGFYVLYILILFQFEVWLDFDLGDGSDNTFTEMISAIGQGDFQWGLIFDCLILRPILALGATIAVAFIAKHAAKIIDACVKPPTD